MNITLYEVLAYDQYYPDSNNRKLLTASKIEADKKIEELKEKYDFVNCNRLIIKVDESTSYIEVLDYLY